ncbi:MAG: hypothetical protein ABSE35_09000 [Bryobacteraceae bacterium]
MKVVERAESQRALRKLEGRRKRGEHLVDIVTVHRDGAASGDGRPLATKPASAEIAEDQHTKWRVGLGQAGDWLRSLADFDTDGDFRDSF